MSGPDAPAPSLLLASTSETRYRMLAAAGVPFTHCEPALDEDRHKSELQARNLRPDQLAQCLAEAKATSVDAGPDTLVLGADQVLELDGGTTFGKPGSRDEARKQLMQLRGGWHSLHSAAVLARAGEPCWSCIETVRLKVRIFTYEFLDHYLDQDGDAALWSAGGYRVEGFGAQLFEEIEGSHFAILGLPLLPLLQELRERAVLAL